MKLEFLEARLIHRNLRTEKKADISSMDVTMLSIAEEIAKLFAKSCSSILWLFSKGYGTNAFSSSTVATIFIWLNCYGQLRSIFEWESD